MSIPYRIINIKGFFKFEGEENPFSGLFDIDSEGEIRGYIDYEPNSPICTTSIVKGKLTFHENFIVMDFIKKYTHPLLADVFYHFKKNKPNEIAGDYKGFWNFNEKVIKIEKSKEAALQFMRGQEFTEDVLSSEQGNNATLTLSKL